MPASAEAFVPAAPPYSGLIRITAGASLLLAGIFNGIPQYVTHLMGKPNSFAAHVAWTQANPTVATIEAVSLLGSMLFVTFGLLGLAQACRWRAPRWTAVGTPLAMWGMWGFHTILAVGFLITLMATRAPVDTAQFAAAVDADPPLGALAMAMGPHIVGSFLGVMLLSVAWLRSGFPRTPAILLIAFLLWDFTFRPIGPLEPHILLAIAWGWMGIYLVRMPDAVWRGADPRRL